MFTKKRKLKEGQACSSKNSSSGDETEENSKSRVYGSQLFASQVNVSQMNVSQMNVSQMHMNDVSSCRIAEVEVEDS